MPQKKDYVNTVHIYVTPEGPKIIESPIKAEILSMLEKEELYFDERLTRLDKSKPTLSSHLKVLEDKGIIGSKSDPADKRKKLFFIKAKQLVELSSDFGVDMDVGDYLYNSIFKVNDATEFNGLLFRAIKIFLLDSGIDINPLLFNMGVLIAESFYDKHPELNLLDVEDFVVFMEEIWQKYSSGRVELASKDPLIINIYENLECDELPNLKRSMGAISAGVMTAAFSRYFQSEVSVEEVKCRAKGDDYCSFEITKVGKKVETPLPGGIEFI